MELTPAARLAEGAAMNFFNKALAVELAAFKARDLARRAKTTVRTAENWKQGRTGPAWRPIVAMLNDDVLRPVILAAAKRADRLGKSPALRKKRGHS